MNVVERLINLLTAKHRMSLCDRNAEFKVRNVDIQPAGA